MKKKTKAAGGRRPGAGRPLRNETKGKANKHTITMHDETWESIVNEAIKLNLSASQYLSMLHNKYRTESK